MIYIFKIVERLNNIIYKIFLKIKYGKRIHIGKRVIFRKRVNIRVEKNGKLVIGDNSFFNNSCSINCMNKITIGNSNLFGENVKIYDHDHIINTINRSHNFNFGEVQIGNDNWIGSDSIILRKANIGNRNVISCCSIINDTIESNKLVKVKKLFDVEEIKYKED